MSAFADAAPFSLRNGAAVVTAPPSFSLDGKRAVVITFTIDAASDFWLINRIARASATTPATSKPNPTTKPNTKPTPARCHTLSATAVPLAELEAVYRTATRLPAHTPLVSSGVVHYGVCGITYYAVDDIGVAPGVYLSYWEQLNQQDQEGLWSREGRGQWIDHGWYGNLCDVAPAALVDAWHIPSTSC
jgi:hypothetical protein